MRGQGQIIVEMVGVLHQSATCSYLRRNRVVALQRHAKQG